jgi:Plasmid maintenance system antidote protein
MSKDAPRRSRATRYRPVPQQGTLEGQAMGEALRALMAKAGVNANKTAAAIGAPHSQIYALLHGDRNISPLLALKLARFFDVDPVEVMLLQVRRDLAEAMAKHSDDIAAIVPHSGRSN